ncbi:MAG TPA: complex I subunit 5 family protein [Kiritimatiellia bacterium]|nr:complex I subunit 5 family protein [Kiritimatiellia bacterium]
MMPWLPEWVAPWDRLVAGAAVGLPLVMALFALAPGKLRLRFGLVPLAVLPALGLAMAPPVSVTWPELLLGTTFETGGGRSLWLGVTALLWLCAGWFGTYYLAHDEHRHRYAFYFLGAMAGNFGVALSRDPASFFTAFAVMSVLSYGLVIHDGTPASRQAGRVYLGMAVLGEVLQFAALAKLLFPMFGKGNGIDFQGLEMASASDPLTVGLFVVGFGIKAGLLGLHVWLPMAHPVAPTPASAVLSGSMIKAGLIGWMMFLPLGTMVLPGASSALIVLGLAGALTAAVFGVVQSHPKAVLAYSSVSQMGLIITAIGVGLGAPTVWAEMKWVVLVYAAHHGFAKCLLFLSVGLRTSRPLAGVENTLFWAGTLFAGLALIGAPFTSGAIAKSLLKDTVAYAGLAHGDVVLALLTVGAIGTTLLMTRFALTLRGLDSHGHEPAGKGIWAPWLVLLILVMGFTLGVAHELAKPETYLMVKTTPWWKALWPMAAGLGLYALGGRALQAGWGRGITIPPGDLYIGLVAALRRTARATQPFRLRLARTWDALSEHHDRKARAWGAEAIRSLIRLENGLVAWSMGSLAALVAAVVIFALASR